MKGSGPWLSAKSTSASGNVTRRGSFSVANAIDGAPTIMPTAKTVTVSPARGVLVWKAAASSGSRPATTNSVVPIKKVPARSTAMAKPACARRASQTSGIAGADMERRVLGPRMDV